MGLLVALLLVLAAGMALAWRPAIAPVPTPAPADLPPALVARGQGLAGAGNCAACHTADPRRPYAGGVGLPSPFGVVYSTNITPDGATGIGHWSRAAFARAMHEGVGRDGRHLFPAFPYDHFTKVSDEDLAALYAFLMTRAPISVPARANTLPFPLNIRALQAGWKLLYFKSGRYRPDPARSAAWNRGAYLGEGLAHCSACHTPRDALGAESSRKAYQGAPIEGWIAPALTAANPSPVAWSEAELFAYLRGGATALHGSAAGPMSPVVHDGLVALPDADIHASAVYYADLAGAPARGQGDAAAVVRAMATSRLGLGPGDDADARLYDAACASCHYTNAAAPSATRPELALTSALSLDQPANFIQVVLHGVGLREGDPALMMPGFAAALDDAEVARLALYLRRTRTRLPPWTGVAPQVAAIRKGAAAP
jgi:mono/diheme cytochrome c family protein